MTISEKVRGYFEAYPKRDRAHIEALLAGDFTFRSPYGELDRAGYWAECWPNSESLTGFSMQQVIESGDRAFALYECSTAAGSKFRNTEYFTFRDGKIQRIEVYFGDPAKTET